MILETEDLMRAQPDEGLVSLKEGAWLSLGLDSFHRSSRQIGYA